MAGISHADSIIADSTVSPSSPTHSIHEERKDDDALTQVEAPEVKVRRVARTYGRPKIQTDVEESVQNDLGFRARILKTSPRDADDQVIPESDDVAEDVPKFQGFAWRAQLRAIDEDLDTSKDESTSHQSTSGSFDTSTAYHDASKPRETNSSTRNPEDHGGLFDGFLSSSLLLSGPATNSLCPPFDCVSPDNDGSFALSFSHRRAVESPIASDSDNTSPQHPYPINSPKRQSSLTPPTSPLGELAQQDEVIHNEILIGDNPRKRDLKEASRKRNSDTRKATESKTKPLTKKELITMQKESARLLAERPVSIPHVNAQSKHTVSTLFNKLRLLPITRDPDPIASFSSPGNMFRMTAGSSSDGSSPMKSAAPIAGSSGSASCSTMFNPPSVPRSANEPEAVAHINQTDEDMPDPNALLSILDEKRVKMREEKERIEARRRAKELEDHKRRALEFVRHRGSGTAGASPVDSDADDDLEVEEMVQSSNASNLAVLSKTQISLAIRSKAKVAALKPSAISQKNLELAAKPTFGVKKGSGTKRDQKTDISQQGLNNLLLQRANRQSAAIEDQKKERWVKAGGTDKGQRVPKVEEKSIEDWLHKGSVRENTMDLKEDNDDHGDHSSEYTPQDVEREEHEGSDVDASERGPPDDGHDSGDSMSTSDDVEANKENYRPVARRNRAIVDSDDEDEEAGRTIGSQRPVILIADAGTLENSGDSPGGDKENSAELAFSFNEDKENDRVPRHHVRGRVVDVDECRQTESIPTSPPPVLRNADSPITTRKPLSRLDAESELVFTPPAFAQRRDVTSDRVLQVLHEEDKDAALSPASAARTSVFRSRSSSPESDIAEGTTLVSPIGFSQLFVDKDDVEEPAPRSAIGDGGFSQFFTQSGKEGDSICGTPVTAKTRMIAVQLPNHSEKDEGFEFTQLNTLLPSVKISESQRREVDEMFGKDQEFKIDEAKRSENSSQHANGSISKTLYLGPFVPSQATQSSPQSIRRPLETLTLDPRSPDARVEESPQLVQYNRLLRERPRERSISPVSPSPPSTTRNAFDVLRDATVKGKQRAQREKQTLGKSEFVEAEAQESDEEAMVGFGGVKGDDDEEGGDEAPDAVIEGLVDDAIMDEKVQAADLVLQKHLEHAAMDDAALEKLHRDAAEGKLRGKRRDRGLGFDDSDSEEEDTTRPRKPLNKKRRVEGDTLEAYGEDPETRPFYDTYHADLAETEDLLLASVGQDVSTQEQEMQNYSDEETVEAVDPFEIRRHIRDFKQGPARSPSLELEPKNANWADSDDYSMANVDDVRVTEGPLLRRKRASTGQTIALDHLEFKGDSQGTKKTDTSEQLQLKAWANQESRSYNSASGRGGFSRKELHGDSSRKPSKLAPMKNSTTSTEGKSMTKSSSLISHVEKRKGFDS